MVSNDFMGIDGFRWFIGVVEDRDDPEKASRVRVRCFGYHDDDLNKIPIEDLPWAQVLAPTDTPSMAGMGNTPHFLVEGSHVFGFFLDANFMQRPVVVGSMPGNPIDTPNPEVGFFDPNGVYPKTLNEPDTNRLVRGSIGETHPALDKRRGMQQTDVPLSTKPHLATGVQPGASADTRKTWNEPDAKSNAPTFYPFNHVHESECGHVHEIDDSPGGERILQQHISGTFTEIHPKGDKVVKVVGDDYEIVIKDKSILIEGDLNLTVKGNKNELIQGDYVLEVEGDMYTKIHKNQRTKVGASFSIDEDGVQSGGGNREEEIIGSHAWDVRQAVKGRVGSAENGARDFDVTIGGNEFRIVNGNFNFNVFKDYTLVGEADILVQAEDNMSLKTVTGIVAIGAGSNVNIRSSSEMKIKSGSTYKLQSVGAANVTYDSTFNAKHTGATTMNYVSTHDSKYDGIATFHYAEAFKEKIDGDTFVDKAESKVDHVHAIPSPGRTSDTDGVDAITPTAPTLP